MQSPDSIENVNETAPTAPSRSVITDPDFSNSPKPIAEFAGRPDFPKCVLGEHVDIGGVGGVVVEIVKQSIKVQSPDGSIQSFNFNRLRTIYGPRPEPVEIPQPVEPAAPAPRPVFQKRPAPEPAPAPKREFIENPDFTKPVQSITELAGLPNFPKCAYGAHVDIAGYVGVIVELVKDSVKVQSQDGIIRSYNGPTLRKIYGKA